MSNIEDALITWRCPSCDTTNASTAGDAYIYEQECCRCEAVVSVDLSISVNKTQVVDEGRYVIGHGG